MKVEQFIRKSFPVDGVQVTADNISEVARWCDGSIHTEGPLRTEYIKVRVQNPLNERQTKAYAGDWVLYAGKGYKVYKDSAFEKSFVRSNVDERNVFEQDSPPVDSASGSSAQVNPGGTHTISGV